MQWEKSCVLETHNSLYLRFCQEAEICRVGLPGLWKMGLVDLLEGVVPVRLGNRCE